MYKKFLSVLISLTLVFCMAAPASAASETAIVLSDSGITVDGKAIGSSATGAVYAANDIIYYKDGTDASYGEGTEAQKHSAAEAAAHTVVHITQPGTYRISGKLSAGQIFVDLGDSAASDKSAVVTLILDGVNITCTVAPAVFFYNVYECSDASVDTGGVVDTTAAGANVIIADGSVNNVTGSHVARIYKEGTTKKLHKYDGAFYSKMSMNLDGSTGTLNITADNEGLDSELHLTINGGIINIKAQDDGINTNEDYISVTTINGGTITVSGGHGSEGDGIDSNGYLTINGGTVIAYANPQTGDGGIDADMAITINGGTVVAFGSRNDAVDSGSKQSYMELSFASTMQAGSVVEVRDASGNTIISGTAERNFQSLTFSNAGMKLDTLYYVYVDGVQQQYTGNQTGMGGFPGGGQGGQIPDGGFTPGERPEQGERPGTGEMPTGEMPEMPTGTNPGNWQDGTETGEGSVDFTLTASVKSFSGVSDADTSGKTRVSFTISGLYSVGSGRTVSVSSITPSAGVPSSDVQITVTDDPSESYSETCLLSDGIAAINAILPTADGNYILTIAVVSGNEKYTGVTQTRFSIGVFPFRDVQESDAAYKAIKYLYDAGIVNGVSGNVFDQQSGMNRAMVVTILGRIAGVEQQDTNRFTDVENGTWYSGYVGWAEDNGVIRGYGDGRFGSYDLVTAAQLGEIIDNYCSLAGISYDHGLTGSQTLTRAEVMIALYEFHLAAN